MASEDDTAYKQLFAHPEMVRDLLLGFVPGQWVQELDLTSLERVSGSYVSDGGAQRHSDMVWRGRLAGEWIYIYLLLEFQSRSDHWMALRMQVYVGLLYQDLVKRRELSLAGKLPPVFPMVLYNGSSRWGASLDLAELVDIVPSDIKHLQAAQRYLLIDQQRLPGTALELVNNFVATAFRIGRLKTADDVVNELDLWDTRPDMARDSIAQQGLTRWSAHHLRRLARKRMLDLTAVASEVKDMTVPFFHNLREALAYEARLDGHRERLRQLLLKRFGKIPARLNGRIEWAEMDELDLWFDRIFEARNVKDIFSANRPE